MLDALGQPKGNILIVDDTPANLRLLSSMLSEQGYKVRSVINGQMALTAAQAAPPDLILLDITMPDMDGYQVCQRLKADERTSGIPIIFISALDATEDKVKAFILGGVDYITKPFQFEEVLARVRTHLALRDMQRQLQRSNDELERRVAERTAELVQLNAALERFVPREFLGFLHKASIAEVKLGDQVQQDMAILFADIRGFTALSERMSPQENFNFLNAYLKRVSPIIRQHHGFIDNYMGDGLMALFPGAPDDAIRAAIAMQREVARYNIDLQRQGAQAISIGIGLHTGCLMLGIIGEEQRVQGTVISDAVNLTDRIEGLTRLYGVSIITTEQAWRRLADPAQYWTRFLDRVLVKGKLEPVSVLEIFDGDSEAAIALKLRIRPDFEAGVQLYYDKEFAQASAKFSQVLEQAPLDKAAQLYLQRTARLMAHGVPPDWSGVETLTEK